MQTSGARSAVSTQKRAAPLTPVRGSELTGMQNHEGHPSRDLSDRVP